nr:11368_t:CDS:2 [Entrophospora candida]
MGQIFNSSKNAIIDHTNCATMDSHDIQDVTTLIKIIINDQRDDVDNRLKFSSA